jgi:4-diphosphocytidyl-2-C-methyl-D-erythritol kinase
MLSIAVFSPAKINLFLAVTGRRADGFHDLVSLVAPISFGDTLWLHAGDAEGPVTLTCDDPAVPTGMDNLAVRAAEAWRGEAGFGRAIHIALKKRIPMGAGLGGGSSNAAAVLRGLNSLGGHPLDDAALARLAAGLGSDCPLFLVGAPCVMRGRGERLEALPAAARRHLTGRRILVFKPDFPISTPWAYGRLVAAGGAAYTPPDVAEARLAAWLAGGASVAEVLFNSFEQVAFTKFQSMPVLLDRLRAQPCVDGVLMSGSGSACFALVKHGADLAPLRELVRTTWGAGAVVVEAEIH